MESILTYNGSHLIYKNVKKLLEDLKVNKHFTSTEHP